MRVIPGVDVVQRHVERQLDGEVFQRDPAYIREHTPALEGAVRRYFAPEVRGVERLPRDGPFLLVSNHSGGMLMPDGWALAFALLRGLGVDRPVYALMFDAAFAIPGFNTLVRRFGAVPASMAHAEQALDAGAGVLAFPGGDWEVYRPWTQRNRIDFHDHAGFVRLALRRGIPIFPTVSHGSHASLIVVSRGDRLVRLLGLDRLRINVFPIILGVPFGLAPVFVPSLPLPTKIVVEVLEPLDWTALGPDASADRDVVRRCYDETTTVMQAALDRLAAEIPHPLLARLTRHTP